MDEGNDHGSGREPLADKGWTPGPVGTPMPLSMPPYSPPPPVPEPERGPSIRPDAGDDPADGHVRATGPDEPIPDTALPGDAGGAPPFGGQPPYLPPYGSSWPPGGLPPEGAEHRLTPTRQRRSLAALGAVALVTAGLGAGLGVALTGTGSAGTGGATGTSGGPTPPGLGGGALSSTGSKVSAARIADSVEPAVVDIRTTVVQPVGQAAGTGMILTSSGEVLTNNHVVENASTIEVSIAGRRGSFPATVIGVNPTKDVALLQIKGVHGLPYVHLGNSSTVSVGDPVVAIGNALGLGGTPSVVTGEISATDRTITASDPGLQAETLHHLLQTTAPIQSGDSGGPLLDASGKVIGMDTANVANGGATNDTIGFAIPINAARAIVDQMRHHEAVGGTILGSAPFLGIYEAASGTGATSGGGQFGGLPGFGGTSGTAGTPPPASAQGVTVAAVVNGGPAQQAGLAQGDVITAIGGTPTPTWSALRKAISARRPGQKVSVAYVGPSGASHTVRVVLGAFPPK